MWGYTSEFGRFIVGSNKDKLPFVLALVLALALLPTANLGNFPQLCFWTVGGSTWREPTRTQGDHANYAQRGPQGWESNL